MTCRRISGAVWCRGWTQPGRTRPDRSGPLTGRTNRFMGHCDPLKGLRRNRFKITNSRFSMGVSPTEAGTCIHPILNLGAFSRFFHEHRGQNHPPCPGSGRIRGVQYRRDCREGEHAGREASPRSSSDNYPNRIDQPGASRSSGSSHDRPRDWSACSGAGTPSQPPSNCSASASAGRSATNGFARRARRNRRGSPPSGRTRRW